MCLGDLGDDGPDPALAAVIESLPRPWTGDAAAVAAAVAGDAVGPKEGEEGDEPGKIAHLLPCGHNLHNDCLKAWVERANSCPICRQSFNVVEVAGTLGGKLPRVIYHYTQLISYICFDRSLTALCFLN